MALASDQCITKPYSYRCYCWTTNRACLRKNKYIGPSDKA